MRTLRLLSLLVLIPLSARAQQGALRGDVDGDGRVTAADAQAVRDHVAGRPARAGRVLLPNGDANGDGRITAVDAAMIQAHASGRDLSRFGIGRPVESGSARAVMYECTVDTEAGTHTCQTPRPGGASRLDVIVGKPYITFSTTGTVSSRGDFTNEDTTSFNVAVVNQMGQPIGTTDGTTAAPGGSRLLFHDGPRISTVKSGTLASATVRIDNPDGIGNFTNPEGTYTRTGVPYYQYDGVLAKNDTSAAKLWRFVFSSNTKTFVYAIYTSAPVQYEYGWIAVSPAAQVVGVGESSPAPAATVYDYVGGTLADGVTWSSSNGAVATVDPSTGVVTGVTVGTATITATSTVNAQRTGTLAVTVEPAEQAPVYLQALNCRASVTGATVSCSTQSNVTLTFGSVTAAGGVFQFGAALTNLLPEGIGTPDGVMADTAGLTVFFGSAPTATGGSGNVSIANADGSKPFTGFGTRPYFRYSQKLANGEVSASRTWQFGYDAGVTSFDFRIYVAAELQPLLVINEVGANPGGTISDLNGEFFEVYNAGHFPVEMQGLVIADSSTAGRRPYHLISSPLAVPSGGFVVLGNTTDTSLNGGVPVDYAYGSALALTNSLDAIKIARAYGAADTLTLDRAAYATATSAQNGISRELKNPSLDNTNIDGANWTDASTSTVYGPGGRGTPGAQNGGFVAATMSLGPSRRDTKTRR